MLQEAIEYVVNEARKSKDARVIEVRHEPDGVYYLQKPDGTVERIMAEASHRRHTAMDLSAVVEFFQENKSQAARIWYSRDRVVCVLDDDTRRESVTLNLELSPQIKRLQQLEGTSGGSMDQRAIVLMLRTTFRRCLGRTDNLLGLLRSIRFSGVSTGEGVVEHGKSSIGKTLQQELKAASELPEYVTLDVPVFTHPSLAIKFFPIECALEPDAAECKFKLLPLPGEIERAVADGETMIAQLIGIAVGDEGMERVHYGKP